MSSKCPDIPSTAPDPPHAFTLHRRMKSGDSKLNPKSATLRQPPRREGKVYPPEAITFCDDDFSMSNESYMALGPMYSTSVTGQQISQSQPDPEFRSARNRSPMLVSTMPTAPEGFSSDEGELVAECFICLQAFEEDSSQMVPRNLQCGHAYCTST